MFGYVKPFQPELKVKELDAYKAVYCGLCGQLGKSFGPLARITLSYDFTFLSMLGWAVSGDTPKVCLHRCYVNPLKKLPMCCGGEPLELGADVATIMIYYKLLDNIRDSGVFSSAAWHFLKPIAGHAHKRAARSRPECEALVAEHFGRGQVLVEQANSPSVDAACEPTALTMGGVFRLLSDREGDSRVLERLGYLTGRYVYLCDALDDMEADVKSGEYNPFVLKFGLGGASGDWRGARAEASESLNMTIGEMEKTLALLSLRDFGPIINNIVTTGLRASVDEILSKKEKLQ